MSNQLSYQPELLLCKYSYSKQYLTQAQIFTEYICKARTLLIQFRLAIEDVSESSLLKKWNEIKDR